MKVARLQNNGTEGNAPQPGGPRGPADSPVKINLLFLPVTYLQNILDQTNTYIPTQANLAFSEKIEKVSHGPRHLPS